MPAHSLDRMGQFGGVGLEELAPRRRAEEQLANFHRAAVRARRGLQFAGARLQLPGVRRARRAAGQAEVGHRGHRRQRLAPKAHGRDRLQVGQRGDLAGGMAPQRQRQVGRFDAAAVVLDHDAAHPAGQQAHGDLRGPGVQRVVDQFAHHRGRAFDDLAGGDLADQFVGQLADATGLAGGDRGRRQRRGIHRANCKSRPCQSWRWQKDARRRQNGRIRSARPGWSWSLSCCLSLPNW